MGDHCTIGAAVPGPHSLVLVPLPPGTCPTGTPAAVCPCGRHRGPATKTPRSPSGAEPGSSGLLQRCPKVSLHPVPWFLPAALLPAVGTPLFELEGEVVGPPCQRLCMCGGVCGCPSQRLIRSRRLEHCDVELSRSGDAGVMGHAVRRMRGLSPPQRASARWKVVGNAFLRATVPPAESERAHLQLCLPSPAHTLPKASAGEEEPRVGMGSKPWRVCQAAPARSSSADNRGVFPALLPRHRPSRPFPFPSPESWCL